MKGSKTFYILIILLLGFCLRANNLNWDNGHYLHPDERLYVNASGISMPDSIEQLLSSDSPLNPNMFYYGSFPLYIYKAVDVIFFKGSNFLYTSRFISALLSTLTIFLIYLAGKKLFSKKVGLIASFVFASAPASIQYAHFNTTESMLLFLLTLCILLSAQILKKGSAKLYILTGIILGFSYATKIVGLTFALLPFTALLLVFFKKKNWKSSIYALFLIGVSACLTGIIFAPYQIIDFEHFWREQKYMQDAVLGKVKPPFQIIYENTPSYIYPYLRVFPFTFGFFSFISAIAGLFLAIKKVFSKKEYKYLLILGFPVIYFLWSGSWYVKFARYYILLIPFLSLYAALVISKLKKPIMYILLFLIVLNGALYIRTYLMPHTRIAASNWIFANVSEGSTITGEHWDDNLPLPLTPEQLDPGVKRRSYNALQLSVYDPDTKQKIEKLTQDLASSNYFIISSRRVFYSILVNKEKYPYTSRFYELLFDGGIGFQLIKKQENYPFYISDDIADESFQSYDHPPVYIFQNAKKLSQKELFDLIFR